MRPNERKAFLAIALNVRIGSQTFSFLFLTNLVTLVCYFIVSVMENTGNLGFKVTSFLPQNLNLYILPVKFPIEASC